MTIFRKLLPIVALALATVLVFLYGMEYYDFVFIKRPEKAEAPTTEETLPPEENDPSTEPQPDDTPPKPDTQTGDAPQAQIDPSTFQNVQDAADEGYYLTTLPYTSEMKIAELRLKIEGTDEFSLRKRHWNRPSYYQYENQNGAAELVWNLTEEPIPAVEAYMGYIFADDGENIFVYDSYGRHLNYFNPNLFEFAYKRDKLGNPLMRRAYKHTAVSKDGTKSAAFTEFSYYYLGRDGGVYNSGYFDPAENRGAMADYPGYYGDTEGSLGRSCTFNRVVQQTTKGRLRSFFRTRWSLTWGGEPINDTIFYALYPFSEGLACATDEEDTMFFVDQNGRKAFETKKEYVMDGRYVIERLLLPLDESTAMGCYYYEHGLVMARRQIYDRYQLEDYDVMYVMSDEYVIIDKSGKLFQIPAGYTVKNYANGVILLEKNGVYGYMDYTGGWLGTPEYEDATCFSEGLAACKKDGKWGVIDTAGNTVLPFIYDHVQPTSSGVIVTHSENGWNIFIKMTK